jgi:hypothetical protein
MGLFAAARIHKSPDEAFNSTDPLAWIISPTGVAHRAVVCAEIGSEKNQRKAKMKRLGQIRNLAFTIATSPFKK